MDKNIVTISSKSRNLGYGWTNNVVNEYNKNGRSHLRIAYENIHCMAQGGPATIKRERIDAFRINNGNDWVGALFVGGKKVIAIWGIICHYNGNDDDDDDDHWSNWSYSEGWISPNTGEILDLLYDGEQIVVKTELKGNMSL
jgi:hypothetical protein